MKKRLLAIFIVAIISVGMLFAASATGSHSTKLPESRLGIGVAVGYPSVDPILTYTYSKPNDAFGVRAFASAGLSFFQGLGMHASVGADWIFYKLEFTNTGSKEAENSVLDFGLGASLAFATHKGFDYIDLAPAGVFSITYTFAKNWTVFTRDSFGYNIWLKNDDSPSWASSFFWNLTLGFTYEFDLTK